MKPDIKEIEDDQLLQLASNGEDSYNNIIDWRRDNAVGPVHKQGSCGGCWAITAAGVMESALRIKTKSQAHEISVQQIIDCASKHNNQKFVSKGCGGGYIEEAFQYAKLNPLLSN